LSGIELDSISNCTLSGNNIANNLYGVNLDSSSNNTIYYNSFNNNTNQVYSSRSTNIWDNGSVGNYWSDYLTKYPNATQVDNSSIWNIPYVIDMNNTDYYPLTHPYGIAESSTFPILRLSIVVTVLAVIVLLAVIIYKKKGGKKKVRQNPEKTE
jgi:parallel beta-helix repeat protein